jgi:hypothetical protein
MLVYFEPAAMCDMQSELLIAPLPAKKQLWEADGAASWAAENEKDLAPTTAFGLAANGDLVKVDTRLPQCSEEMFMDKSFAVDRSLSAAAAWEEWCSGMDSFGGLVMLAASLVG